MENNIIVVTVVCIIHTFFKRKFQFPALFNEFSGCYYFLKLFRMYIRRYLFFSLDHIQMLDKDNGNLAIFHLITTKFYMNSDFILLANVIVCEQRVTNLQVDIVQIILL